LVESSAVQRVTLVLGGNGVQVAGLAAPPRPVSGAPPSAAPRAGQPVANCID
jgi:hypothetical protein